MSLASHVSKLRASLEANNAPIGSEPYKPTNADLSAKDPSMEPEDTATLPAKVADIAHDIIDAEEDVTSLQEACKGLESVLSFIANDPYQVTSRDVNYIRLAVDGYASRIGLEGALMPSNESGQTPNQMVASLENRATEMLKKAWEWIKEMWRKTVDFVKSFFERYFTELGRLNAKAKKVLARAEKVTGNPKQDTIDIGQYAAITTYKGKIFGLDAIDAISKATTDVPAGYHNLQEAAGETTNLLIKFSMMDESKVDEFIEELKKIKEKGAERLRGPFFSHKSGENIYVSDSLPGGLKYELRLKPDWSYRVTRNKDAIEEKKSFSAKVAGLDEIRAVVQKAVGFCDAFESAGRLVKDISKDPFGKLNSFRNEKLSEAAIRKIDNEARELITSLVSAGRFFTMLSSDIYRIVSASLSIADKMLDQYEAPAAEPKKEAA